MGPAWVNRRPGRSTRSRNSRQLDLLVRRRGSLLGRFPAADEFPVRFVDIDTGRPAAAFQVDGDVRRDLRFHRGEDRYETQLQAGLDQRLLIALVDVRGLVEVVG